MPRGMRVPAASHHGRSSVHFASGTFVARLPAAPAPKHIDASAPIGPLAVRGQRHSACGTLVLKFFVVVCSASSSPRHGRGKVRCDSTCLLLRGLRRHGRIRRSDVHLVSRRCVRAARLLGPGVDMLRRLRKQAQRQVPILRLGKCPLLVVSSCGQSFGLAVSRTRFVLKCLLPTSRLRLVIPLKAHALMDFAGRCEYRTLMVSLSATPSGRLGRQT